MCTTGADGRWTGTATFSVSALSGSNVTDSPGANHDPDGGSDGTVIGVANP